MTVLVDCSYVISGCNYHCSIICYHVAPSGSKNLVSGNILINRKGSFNHGWNLFHMTVLILIIHLMPGCIITATPPAIMLAQCKLSRYVLVELGMNYVLLPRIGIFLSRITSYDGLYIKESLSIKKSSPP